MTHPETSPDTDPPAVPSATFTFFVDGDLYFYGGGELPATEEDLREAGVWRVDIPTNYGMDLAERIPVRVEGTVAGIRFYAAILGLRDPLQLEEMERVLAAATRRAASGA